MRASLHLCKYIAYSARTGAKYPEATSARLEYIADRCKFTSPYWLTRNQAKHFIGVDFGPTAEGFPITFSIDGKDVNVKLYNIEQTTNQAVIEAHITQVTGRAARTSEEKSA